MTEMTTAVAQLHDVHQRDLRELLCEWLEQAGRLWQLTSEIGNRLISTREHVAPDAWPAWLGEVGLTPYQAFVFMRATRYPQLMQQHRPGNLEAVARLLPQGQGTAFDTEQAALARELAAGGMSRQQLRVHLGVSNTTVTRWLDPEKHAQQAQQRAAQKAGQRKRIADERARRRAAALKAKGGPGSLAYQHLRRAAVALDEAWRTAEGREAKQAYGAALEAIYRGEEQVMRAEGIR